MNQETRSSKNAYDTGGNIREIFIINLLGINNNNNDNYFSSFA